MKAIFDWLFARQYCYTCKKKHSMIIDTIICDYVGRDISYETPPTDK